MRPKFIAVLVLIALFLVILIQNLQPVTLRLFFWKVSMSQIILIPIIMAIGAVIGFIIAKVAGNRRKRKNRI
ncbi:MAG: lipopolysaccharide assembly protein LapA domain-containing protein [Thermodesulfobacteriota bacterium]